MPWLQLHTHERFLRTLTEERWGLKETEGGVAVMAEDEAPEREADEASADVLLDVGDHPALSMGEAKTVVPDVVRQMRELEEILRDGARRAGALVDQGSIYYQAEKTLFRCVDEIKRFNSWVEDDYSRGH